MKQFRRPLLALILCAVLLIGMTTSTAAPSVTLTAINDSFLPLSASTMPERRGGTQYVPYSVFSGTLGVSGSYNSADQTLSMSSGSTVLRFDLSHGTVYDQNMNSYGTPAYWINGTIYVPVKLVCGKFGMTYSNISAAVPILRICNASASLSDSAFASSSAATIRSMLDAYNSPPSTSASTPQGGGIIPPNTDPNAPAAPLQKPSVVYLSYFGAPDTDTPAILDALDAAQQHAIFFLPADGTLLNEDLLRQIIGRGHTVGFTLLSSAQEMSSKLRAANDTLFRATGTVSRLLSISNGSEHLSTVQRDGLMQAGYRIWDTTLDSRDHSYEAQTVAQTAMTAIGQTTEPTVIRMGHYRASAHATTRIIEHLRTYNIPISEISLTRTPINHLPK